MNQMRRFVLSCRGKCPAGNPLEKLDLCNFKRIQNSVGESVAALTSEMSTNSSPKVLRCLANVDGLTVEVVKGIHSDALTESLTRQRLNEVESRRQMCTKQLHETRGHLALQRWLDF